jgi:hypothetical protein
MLSVEDARRLQGTEVDPTPAGELVEGVKLSPAMRKLTPRARAFVMAMVELGGRDFAAAAAQAGYTGTTHVRQAMASRLAADPRVQEALVEEAKALARSSSLLATAEMVKMLNDVRVSAKDRLTAMTRIISLAGMDPEKQVHVKHDIEVAPTTREQIDRVIALCRDTGMDPRKLLGRAGVVLDAEFKVVSDRTGLEDLL